MSQESQEMYGFINNCKPDHLTITDVKKMKVGDQIDVVIWDRNFEEYWIWENAENEKSYDPQVFFAENRHTITYKGNMTWDIDLWEEVITHPIHLNTEHLQTHWTWYGIDKKDGEVHITNEILKGYEDIQVIGSLNIFIGLNFRKQLVLVGEVLLCYGIN